MTSILQNLWALWGHIATFLAVLREIKELLGTEQAKALLATLVAAARKVKEEGNNPDLVAENTAAMSDAGINTALEPIPTDPETQAVVLRVLGMTEGDYCDYCNAKHGNAPCHDDELPY